MFTSAYTTTERLRRCLPAALGVLLCQSASAFELEMGAVTLNDTFTVPSWTTVTYAAPFDVRPLVFVLPTNQGSDPSTVRIRNISTSGFEVLQVEPTANDGPHVAMSTAYLAIEPGNHLLPDGSRITAIDVSTTASANRLLSVTWTGVSFPSVFGLSPAVLTQIQTLNNESLNPPGTSSAPFMDVSIQSLSTSFLQLTLERAESTAGTVAVAERVGVLAIDDQTNISFVDAAGIAVQLQSLATPDNIVGWTNGCIVNNYPVAFTTTPLTVASVNSRDGNNGGWIRRCSQSSTGLGLTVDEDIDTDSERSHTTERAGIVAASGAFHANFDVELNVAKSFTTVSDPINGTSNQKPIPEAVVEYTVNVENLGSLSPDSDSLTITDIVPSELSLCVTATCLAGGPIILDVTGSPAPPGVSIGLIEYSDDGGISYTYTPVPDVSGYDPVVNAVRINLTGTFSSITTTGPPSFDLVMAAEIK